MGSEQKSRQGRGAIMYQRLLGSWILSRPACPCHHHSSASRPASRGVHSVRAAHAIPLTPNHSRRRRVSRCRHRLFFFNLGLGLWERNLNRGLEAGCSTAATVHDTCGSLPPRPAGSVGRTRAFWKAAWFWCNCQTFILLST